MVHFICPSSRSCIPLKVKGRLNSQKPVSVVKSKIIPKPLHLSWMCYYLWKSICIDVHIFIFYSWHSDLYSSIRLDIFTLLQKLSWVFLQTTQSIKNRILYMTICLQLKIYNVHSQSRSSEGHTRMILKKKTSGLE